MRNFTTVLVLLSLAFIKVSNAQTPVWQWAQTQIGGACYTQAQQAVASPSGYIFISGRYAGTMTLGGKTVSGSGNPVFSAKLDSSGKAVWIATHTTGAGYSYGFGIDKRDNNYSTGPGFIDKYDSSGNQKWSIGISGGTGYDVKVSNSGFIYLTGEYGNTLTIGTKSVSSVGGEDMYLAKLDSNGNCIWIVSGGGSGYDGGRELGIDGSGYIYVCGSYSSNGVFGSQSGPVVTSGFPNLFITKYDTSGNALMVSTATNAGFNTNAQYWRWEELAVDSSGNTYVAGNFKNSAQFGSIALPSAANLDVFVAKCHFDGKWEWAKSIKSSAAKENQAIGITVDKASDVYVVGDFFGTTQFGNFTATATSANGSPFVAKFSNSSGDVQWVQTNDAGSTGNWSLEGVTVATDGSVYVDGNGGGGTGIFGSHSVISQFNCYSDQNIFVAKLGAVPPRAILPVLNRSYCPGETIDLPYTLIGSFNAGNIFDAQLSDSTGNFISYTDLGSITANSDGTISITIPPNIPAGTHYFIRIVSSSPATSSYAAPNGNVVNGSYKGNFFITIGGGNTATITVSKDTTVCPGVALQLHASGATTYSWSPGALLNDSTSANPYAAPLVSQTYTVTAASACGTGVKTVGVTVIPGATITVSPANSIVCSGMPVTLNATGALTYTWTPAIGLSCSTCANPVATPTVSTTYAVTGNGGACSNTFLDTVNVGNTALGGTITFVRDTICQNTPGNLTLAGSSGVNLQWQSSADGDNFGNVEDTTTKYKTTPLQQTTWYRVTVGSGSCSAISDTQKLYVPPALTAYFNSAQTSSSVIAFNSDSSGGGIRSYHWDFGDNNTSTEQNPVHTFTKDTTYYVCLTLYDGSNCSYTFCRYTDVTDGVPTISAAGNWIVYPNPFSEQLAISSKQTNCKVQSIEMYDVLGQLALHKNNTATSLQLDVSALAKGMYYVMIKTADADYVQKVVKQ